jgi:hypothetical protein
LEPLLIPDSDGWISKKRTSPGNLRPAHLPLTIEAYQELTHKSASIVDLLAMPSGQDNEFEAPRMGKLHRPADLS